MIESTFDLVVVGGGLAGFSAALEAAESGLDVLLIEKLAEIGGSSVMSAGCIAFAGTDLQRAQGIEDSNELLFHDLREIGECQNDESIVQAYVANQLSTYHWLCAKGALFSPAIETASGQSVPRLHTVDPADLVRLLARRCRDTGRVDVTMETAARRLLRHPQTRRVEGVVVERGGQTMTVAARRAVLLACGGFVNNRDMVQRFAPAYGNAILIGGEGNVGDGLRMAWHLGADFRDVAYIKGTYGKHPFDTHNNHSCLAVYKGAIVVNQNGERYIDESIPAKTLGDACLAQPSGCTYQILDQDIFEQGDDRVRILDFNRRLEEGSMIRADSVAELAQMIDIPADMLRRTVDRYNGFVAAGDDLDFGRKHLVHTTGDLRRIERAPFYAYPSAAAVYGTYCGVCIDAGMRVIDVFGEVIEGLLAAGEMVGGLHGAAHMPGSSLGKAAIFGRIAARTACDCGASRER